MLDPCFESRLERAVEQVILSERATASAHFLCQALVDHQNSLQRFLGDWAVQQESVLSGVLSEVQAACLASSPHENAATLPSALVSVPSKRVVFASGASEAARGRPVALAAIAADGLATGLALATPKSVVSTSTGDAAAESPKATKRCLQTEASTKTTKRFQQTEASNTNPATLTEAAVSLFSRISSWQPFQGKGMHTSSRNLTFALTGRPNLLRNKSVQRLGLSIADVKRSADGRSMLFQMPIARSRLHCAARNVTISRGFDFFIGLVLLAYAATIGIQVELSAAQDGVDAPVIFRVFELAFCGIFSLELAMRLYVFRLGFFCSNEWQWNMFDMCAVFTQILEEVVAVSALRNSDGDLNYRLRQIKLLRFLRLVRVLRVLRLVRFVEELHKVAYLMIGSLPSFAWTFALLMLLTYIAGTLVTQLVADYDLENPGSAAHMQIYWGSVGGSVFSLYQSVSGGISWKEVSDPLRPIGMWLTWLFGGYIAFAVLVMLNLVTGVFVQSAHTLKKKDMKVDLVAKLHRVLDAAGVAAGGSMTWGEFQKMLEQPELSAFFGAIGIEEHEAVALFQVLDSANQGCITEQDFVLRSLKLQGPATAFELAKLQRETRHQSETLVNLIEGLGRAFQDARSHGPSSPKVTSAVRQRQGGNSAPEESSVSPAEAPFRAPQNLSAALKGSVRSPAVASV